MPQQLPETASVVIVGGGAIGCSIAFHLAQAGLRDVLLLDSGPLGAGSTCKAAGGVRASFSDPVNIAMGLRGLEVFSSFHDDLDQPIDLSRNGYLYCLSTEQQVQAHTEAVAVQNHFGVPSRMVHVDEAMALSPLISDQGLLGAAWSPDDGRATPEGLVAGYARGARRLGATLVTSCAVTGIESSGGAVTAVRAELGVVRTSKVVCAAGAWSAAVGAMVGITLPVTPYRRVIAFTAPTEKISPQAPLTSHSSSGTYFHPEGRGVAFGWSDPAEPSGFDTGVRLHAWMEKVAPLLSTWAPSLLELPVRTAWAGLYETTPDHNQIIGESQAVPGFFYATGFSGHGLMMAPATGEIVRDLVLGATPAFDISTLDVKRFSGSQGTCSERHII